MSEDLLNRRVKAALNVAPADPALRARIMSSLPIDRRLARRSQGRWAPLIAMVLAATLVAMLIVTRQVPPAPARSSSLPQVALGACQLPVWGTRIGFLDVSTGVFTPAASAAPSLSQSQFDLYGPVMSYDRAARAWVPVQHRWIAPDGMSYVYLSGSDIHIRYLPSQTDRVLFSGKLLWSGPYLIGWSGGLIYYTTRQAVNSDLWAIDPVRGTNTQVAPMQDGTEWWYADANAIWGSAYYTGKIARYDTKTHAVTSWAADTLIEIVGTDSSGDPIVLVGEKWGDSGQLAIMPRNGTTIPLGSSSDVFTVGITVIPDGDRIWISASNQNVWVYSPDTGLVLLDQAATDGFTVAGGCISLEEIQPPAS